LWGGGEGGPKPEVGGEGEEIKKKKNKNKKNTSEFPLFAK
jgi:hypothetical protein